MKIPKTFQLAGHTFEVVCSNELMNREGNLGEAQYNLNRIVVHTGGVPKSVAEQTFCHELFHMIFHVLGETEARSNEKLVDNLGTMLHQFLNTQKGNADA